MNKSNSSTSQEITSESARRRELDDTEFIAQWFDQTQPAFLPLHAPIELLRKRDPKIFFHGQERT
jgi:hypothetical protein